MSQLFVSIILAYFISGIGTALKDLTADPINRPGWARNPTLSRLILQILIWPYADLLNGSDLFRNARTVAFSSAGIILSMVVITAMCWGSIYVPGLVFNSMILRIATVGILIALAILLVMPIVNLVLTPVLLLLMAPLDIIFPRKD